MAILGGGIAGLAAAHQLQQRWPGVAWDLFEAQPQLGGVLSTEEAGGFLIERSADMISTLEPWAVELCRRIGFEDELINTEERFRRAFVVRSGKLYPVPEGFTLLQPRKLLPVLRSRLLSWPAKLRLLGEFLVAARKSQEDESLADFTIRRFGREVFERLVQPLVGGIYTADPYRLSMAATLDRFARMEREHGGLIRAVLARPTSAQPQKKAATEGSGARYGMFVAPRRGMSSWIEALVTRLRPESLHTQHTIRQVTRTPEGTWWLTVAPPGGQEFQAQYAGIIMALSARIAGRLLGDADQELAERLTSIPHASAAIAVLGLRRDQVRHPLDGFGFVVPLAEQRSVLAASFSSVKFPGRAPDNHVLLRIFLGGACQPELLQRDDQELLRLAKQEVSELLGVQGTPELERLIRWSETMPQYHVGHLTNVAAIEQRLAAWPTLALAGNSYRGVGIPFCVGSGEAAADRIAAAVTGG